MYTPTWISYSRVKVYHTSSYARRFRQRARVHCLLNKESHTCGSGLYVDVPTIDVHCDVTARHVALFRILGEELRSQAPMNTKMEDLEL